MKEKLIRFMQGRYGTYGADSLNKFLLRVSLAIMIISLFTKWNILYGAALLVLAYSYFRTFSRNYTGRYAENQLFLKKTEGIRRFFTKQKNVIHQKGEYHIYKCPNCKQKIRIPRGRGKVAIRCPKCSNEFIKKS